MIIWGSISEFLVDLNGNGKLWLFIDNWYNPVFITINGNGLTIIPQLISSDDATPVISVTNA